MVGSSPHGAGEVGTWELVDGGHCSLILGPQDLGPQAPGHRRQIPACLPTQYPPYSRILKPDKLYPLPALSLYLKYHPYPTFPYSVPVTCVHSIGLSPKSCLQLEAPHAYHILKSLHFIDRDTLFFFNFSTHTNFMLTTPLVLYFYFILHDA